MDENNCESIAEEMVENFLPDFIVDAVKADQERKQKIEVTVVKALKMLNKAYCPECDDWFNLEGTTNNLCPNCSCIMEDKIMKNYSYKENPQYVVTRSRPRVPDKRIEAPDCEESIVQFDPEKCVKPYNKFIRFDESGVEVREVVMEPCEFNQKTRCGITPKGRTLHCRRDPNFIAIDRLA